MYFNSYLFELIVNSLKTLQDFIVKHYLLHYFVDYLLFNLPKLIVIDLIGLKILIRI